MTKGGVVKDLRSVQKEVKQYQGAMQGLKEAMNRLELQKIEAMGPYHWQDAVKEEDIDKTD